MRGPRVKVGSKDESGDKGWVKEGRMGLTRRPGMKDRFKDRPKDEGGVQIRVKG